MSGSATLIWSLATWLVFASAGDPKELYKRAEELYKRQQLQKADRGFQKTIAALERYKKQQSKGSIIWHRLNYGQANALLFRSRIAKRGKRLRQSCRLYFQVITKLKRLPNNWKSWNVPEDAKQRLIQAQSQFTAECGAIPSWVHVQIQPANAQLERWKDGQWTRVSLQKVQRTARARLSVVGQKRLKLRIRATGYLSIERTVSVSRWSRQDLAVQLKPKPKVIVRVRPRPRLPKPKKIEPSITEQWWFWTIIGVAAAGVVAGGLGIAYATAPYTEGLRNCPNQPGFSLWGPVPNCPK